MGLSLQPLSQALQEYAEQAKPYGDIHALTGASRNPTPSVGVPGVGSLAGADPAWMIRD